MIQVESMDWFLSDWYKCNNGRRRDRQKKRLGVVGCQWSHVVNVEIRWTNLKWRVREITQISKQDQFDGQRVWNTVLFYLQTGMCYDIVELTS